MMSNDLELMCLEAEARRLAAYVAPHDMARCWLNLASVVAACSAAIFVLAGWLHGDVSLAGLLWATPLAAAIVCAVRWKFRWEGRMTTIGEIAAILVAHAVAVPDDLEDVRMRLILCRARIAHLKRSRR